MRQALDARQSPSRKPATAGKSSKLFVALTIGATVFLASVFGIVSTSSGNLLSLWPANAILLGILLRDSRFATPAGWAAAMLGLFTASLATGNAIGKSASLCTINLVSVTAAYWMYRPYDENIRRLKRSRAVLIMVINILVAGAVSGIVGTIVDPVPFRDSILHGSVLRFANEVVNYLAILPVVLAAPEMSWRWLERRRQITFNLDFRESLPFIVLFLSCAMSMLGGGPGALAFPVPALLWCSVSYSVSSTALLTLGFSIWTLMNVSVNVVNPAAADSLLGTATSVRVSVALLALAPICLSVVMEARNELMRRLLDIASRDQLTGLLNRHAFRERGNALLARLGQDRKPASLLMINIDHFKSVNETYGYNAGDNALASFSKVVTGCLRGSDLFGRLGGEEFAVLLPECANGDAQMVAERIRRTIAETPVELGDDLHLVVTASIGTASTLIGPIDIDPLLLTADSALYRAKKTGRNKVMEGAFKQDAPHTPQQGNY